MIGFWQIAIILYILFLALGPRRVVAWIRWTQALNYRLRGRTPPPPTRRFGWLRALELLEHSSLIGWGCVALGFGLIIADGVWLHWGAPLLAVAVLLLFIAPWLL